MIYSVLKVHINQGKTVIDLILPPASNPKLLFLPTENLPRLPLNRK